MEGGNLHRRNPEVALRAVEASGAKPFDILANQVPGKIVLNLLRDKRLMTALKAAGWPTGEEECDKIGEGIGLGAEQVAAVAKYHHALVAGRDEHGKLN